MALLSRLVLSALIASAASLHAQDAAQNHASPSSPAPALCDPDSFEPGSPLEVLSDTSSVDLRQYLWDVTRKIRISWHKAIPADARSSSSNKGCATVEFSIEKDGKLGGMKLVQSSGECGIGRGGAGWNYYIRAIRSPAGTVHGRFSGAAFSFPLQPPARTPHARRATWWRMAFYCGGWQCPIRQWGG